MTEKKDFANKKNVDSKIVSQETESNYERAESKNSKRNQNLSESKTPLNSSENNKTLNTSESKTSQNQSESKPIRNKKSMNKTDIFKMGVFKLNPVFTMMLGLCPVLAVTTSLENGLGMGIAVLFVLFFSNVIISSLKNVISDKIRLPSYIVIIATFVTIVSMLLEAFIPSLFQRLGIYIPLIVVNCIILSRAEIFAKKNTISDSMFDALGVGLGFTLALCIIGLFRELLGTASLTLVGQTIFSLPIQGAVIMILPPGALFTIGFIIAYRNYLKTRKKQILSAANSQRGATK